MSTAAEPPTHLVVVDTCSVLGIVRAGSRGGGPPPGEVAAAMALHDATQADAQGLVLAVCDVSYGEFDSNVEGVALTARNSLREIRNRLLPAHEVAAHLGLGPVIADHSSWDEAIVAAARALAELVLGDATPLEVSTADRERAYGRTVARRAPARQGAAATHDCMIAERAMRASPGRPRGSTMLLTSNAKDFGGEHGRLNPDLAADFDAVGLEYATTWAEVAGRLRYGDRA
jgi:hypothetical protein